MKLSKLEILLDILGINPEEWTVQEFGEYLNENAERYCLDGLWTRGNA